MARVAVIEDKGENLELMVYLLTAFGHEPLVARNGSEGLDLVHATHPDLILMDIQMPVMNGLEATAALKADPNVADIPIIALTAYAMVGDREQIMTAGFDSYITKPIDIVRFRREIERMLSIGSVAGPALDEQDVP
jgi:CheY-like chemotaxis protein